MNTLIQTCKVTLVATTLSMAFAPVLAESDGAQAQTNQQTSSSGASNAAGTQGTSSPDTSSASSGSSGSTDSSGSASSSGQSSQQGAASGKSKSAQSGSAKGKDAKAPVYLLVPVDAASNDNAMKNGCWARLYSRENYGGDMLTLVGPTLLADMDSSSFFGLNWDDRVESVELGPKATMTVYDNESYRDQVAQFKPGQRVADVSRRMGLFDEFASLRIDCQQG